MYNNFGNKSQNNSEEKTDGILLSSWVPKKLLQKFQKSFPIPQTIFNSLLDWSFQNLSLFMSYLQRCPVYNNAHCFSLLIANSSSSFRALLRFPSTCYVHSCYILGSLSTKPDPLFEDYFILAASTNVHLLVVNGSILKFPP